jgi:hypothetical protein
MGRHLTTAVTMLVLVGILVTAAVWGWRSLTAELPDAPVVAAEPDPSCTPALIERGERIRARQVRVSVFNSGTEAGLAGETMDALVDRGFQAGETANAPSEIDVRRVQVWTTERDDLRARLVARQFGKQARVRVTDEDLGPGVDVVVGNQIRRLVKAPRSLRVRQPEEVCVPVLTDPAA